MIRNPWEKVVSHYNYRVKTNQTLMKVKPIDFKEWVIKVYGEKKDLFYYDNPKMFQSQAEWLKDDSGKIMVDKIIRFENLEKDFSEVAEIIGIKEKLPHLNKTITKNYQEVFNHNTARIVENWFEEDIKLFGYKY